MDKKGVGLVFATALISGFSIFLNKFGVSGMDPALFTTAKNVLVAIFLVSTLLLVRDWSILKDLKRRELLYLVLIGLIGGALPFLLFFTGLSMTSAAQGALIHKTLFVWVAILAALTLKEKVSKNMVIGGVLLLLGNVVLLKVTGFDFGAGDILILVATLLWAGEITLSKKLLVSSQIPGRVVALGRMGFGALFLLTYLAFTGKISLVAGLGTAHWLWILLTATFLYGYVFTFYEGLARVPASVATAVLLLGTVITTLLNLLWTGNIVGTQILGSTLLVAGILTFVDIRTLLQSPRRAPQ